MFCSLEITVRFRNGRTVEGRFAPVPNIHTRFKIEVGGCQLCSVQKEQGRMRWIWTRAYVGIGRVAATRTRVWAEFPPNACENSKYPKGTPLAPNFSYLTHSTFHTTSNVREKSFYSFWSILDIDLGNFRLEYLIHLEMELNIWIYHVHPQWKENTIQPLSNWFYERISP